MSLKKLVRLLFLALPLLLGAAQAQSQNQTGTLKGTVKDSRTGEPVIGANVVVRQPIFKGTSTDAEGNFTLAGLPEGSLSVEISSISYKTRTYPDVLIRPGETTTLPISLEDESRQVSEVVVTEQRRRDTDISLINEMRRSTVVSSGISAEQIARSTDRDAAQAVQRVPGITIQDSRFVIVRGLAQRYNQTLINDAIAPSTEVDTRSFSFDLIPSSVIDRMTVAKSASADAPGDFAGGVIRLYTKNVVSQPFTSISVSGGYRGGITFQSFGQSVRSGTDALGFDNGLRGLPAGTPGLQSPSTVQNYTSLIRQFNNNFRYTEPNAAPDLRANVSFGRRIRLRRGYATNLTSISYTNAYSGTANSGVERYRYNTDGSYIFNYRDSYYQRDNRVGIIHNWAWLPSERNRYELRTMFNQMGEDETTVRTGTNPANRGDEQLRLYAFRYTQRSLVTSQLQGFHTLGANGHSKISWLGGVNYMRRSEPDYRRFRQVYDTTAGQYKLINPAGSGGLFETGRFYSNLKELGLQQTLAFETRLNLIGDSGINLKAGYYADYRQRDFQARFFAYRITDQTPFERQEELLSQAIDNTFTDQNLVGYEASNREGFRLEEGTRPQDHYTGTNLYLAPYVQGGTQLGPLNVNAGLRLEYNRQRLDSETDLGKVKVDNPILAPLANVNLGYNLGERSLIRAAFANTVNRPEFRELAPFVYYDFNTDFNYAGTPGLKTAFIQNADLRYEYYPGKGEAMSAGIFYKHFRNPIELGVAQSGSGPQYKYINAASAYSAGAEIEVRRSLQRVTANPFLQRFAFIANASYIFTRVDLGADSAQVANQDRRRPLQGQSPYVVNLAAYYTDDDNGWNLSLAYNIFGKRIFAVGDNQLPTVYELPRHVVDLSLSKKLNKWLDARATVADLFNYGYRFYQDTDRNGQIDIKKDDPIFRYRRGSLFTLGLTATL